MNRIDQEQRQILTGHVEQLKQDDTLFIVEDPFQVTADSHSKVATYLPLHRQAMFNQVEGQKPALVHFLADIIKGYGGEVINVEWRQQAIISYLFYIAYMELKRTNSPYFTPFCRNARTLYGSTLADTADSFQTALARAREYRAAHKDGALAAYYDRVIKKLEATLPYADLLSASSFFYWDAVRAVSLAAQEYLHTASLLWGSELLDLYALHAIQVASAKKKICVIMGGVHIAALSEQLPLCGYTQVNSRGTNSLTAEEYAYRAVLADELFEVSQFVPYKAASWFGGIIQQIKGFYTKNIWHDTIAFDTEKRRTFDALVTKLAYAKSVNDVDFNLLLTSQEDAIPGVMTVTTVGESFENSANS